MTDCWNSTVSGADGTYFSPGQAQAHTPASCAFGILLMHIRALLAAEAEIETAGFAVLGTELAQELRRAEQAREALIESCCDVIAADVWREEDRGLRHMAFFLLSLLEIESDAERQHLHFRSVLHRDVFGISGAGVAGRQAQKMQMEFFSRLDDLAQLQEFGGPGGALDDAADASEPVPA